jgi:hypothetical protein
MASPLPDAGSGDLPPAEVPWYLSTWFILAHAAFVGVLAMAVVLLEWWLKGLSPAAGSGSALAFAGGAAIGLLGVRPMIEMYRASGPYHRLRRGFTGGRFLTLACPMLSPRYWRSVRELRRELREGGIPPGPPLAKQLLAMMPPGLALGAGWAARHWLAAPAMSGALAFLGCMLTWGDLSAMLSRRPARDRR